MQKTLYIIIVLFFASCLDANQKSEKEILSKFMDGRKALGLSLTDHFPSELRDIKKLSIGFPAGAYGTGMASMIYAHQVDSSEFSKTYQKLNLNKIRSYQPTDSLLIIIGDTLDYSKKEDGIPIPNFQSYEDNFGPNSKYLSENNEIYVLESKPGKFMEEEYLTSNNNLPAKWKNGFSRGIAINEKQRELVYWTCVW